MLPGTGWRVTPAQEVVEGTALLNRRSSLKRWQQILPCPALSDLYGEDYYVNYGGVGYGDHEPWTTFFGNIAKRLHRAFKPRSAIDVGCATGVLVKHLQKHGIKARGADASRYAVEHAVTDGIFQYDIAGVWEDPEQFDLVTCIEVLEHVSEENAATAIGNLCRLVAPGGVLVFSSVPPEKNAAGEGDVYHTNVKPPEYWLNLFRENSFLRTRDDVEIGTNKTRTRKMSIFYGHRPRKMWLTSCTRISVIAVTQIIENTRNGALYP